MKSNVILKIIAEIKYQKNISFYDNILLFFNFKLLLTFMASSPEYVLNTRRNVCQHVYLSLEALDFRIIGAL